MDRTLNSRQQAANFKQGLRPSLIPGNIGDINSAIWPFWFTFNTAALQPNNGMNTSFTVTQEAAFVLMSMSKVVFKRSGISPNWVYTAINALDPSETNANANDLSITMRDAQSTRNFFGRPMAIDEIGCAEFPTPLPTPQFILPNSTIECIYQNNHASEVYVPFITVFGYRLRIDNAINILSTITG